MTLVCPRSVCRGAESTSISCSDLLQCVRGEKRSRRLITARELTRSALIEVGALWD